MEPAAAPPPPLRRDSFVANVLWAGISFACEGRLSRDVDFRGNHERGQVSCNDGQGDSFNVLWDEDGVVVHIHEHELPRWASLNPPPPVALQRLADLAVSGEMSVTGWIWIWGDASSPRLPPPPQSSVFVLLDAMCGPLLVTSDTRYALQKDLFDAIGSGQVQLTEGLIGRLLDRPYLRRFVNHNERLDAARAVADDLSRFGLVWPNVERDVTERG